MKKNAGNVRISLQLADGSFYPVFRYGDFENVNLLLVPASEGQSEVDIFFLFSS